MLCLRDELRVPFVFFFLRSCGYRNYRIRYCSIEATMGTLEKFSNFHSATTSSPLGGQRTLLKGCKMFREESRTLRASSDEFEMTDRRWSEKPGGKTVAPLAGAV